MQYRPEKRLFLSSMLLFNCQILLLSKNQCHGFSMIPPPMILNGLVGGSEPTLPRDVKDAVSKCRESVQVALQQRISRMVVEMPVGANFGVEQQSKGKKLKSIDASGEGLTREALDKSNRELCRLFVDMFGPVGSDNIAAVFTEEYLAEAARKNWKGVPSALCRILSVNSHKKKSLKKKRSMGFAAKMNSELEASDASKKFTLPKNCEVALFVDPGPRELPIIEKLCSDLDMGTLVILLNARLDSNIDYPSNDSKNFFMNEFTSVFHLAAAPQDSAPNCLMYHSFLNPKWLLARKPKVGQPKVIGSSTSKFSPSECEDLYNSMDVGDVEVVVEGVLNNVANWFR